MLFAEEAGRGDPGAPRATRDALVRAARDAGLRGDASSATPNRRRPRAHRAHGDRVLLDESRVDLHRAWSSTTHAMQRLRDNPEARTRSTRASSTRTIRACTPRVTFDAGRRRRRAASSRRARGRAVAILREQGVNGQVEMAAAFDRAGFDAYDVHMSDLAAGGASLADFKGFVGVRRILLRRRARRGRGLGQVDPASTRRVRDDFAAFFARADVVRARRLQRLPDDVHAARHDPGRRSWPRFVRNRSEQFEGRFVMVEVTPSPSLFFAGMEGSRIPVATAHGEGLRRVPRRRGARGRAAARRAALRRQSRHRDRDLSRTTPTARRRASRGSRPPTAASRS